jgi:hypothetical protein
MNRTERPSDLRIRLVAFESDPVFAPDGTICARRRVRDLEVGPESHERQILRRSYRSPTEEKKAR